MRSYLLGMITVTTLAVGLGGHASAADMGQPVYKAPPPGWTWNGFYIGGHVGYGWMRSTDQISGGNAASSVFLAGNGVATSIPLDPKGFVGGAQIGYNWQFAPRWIAGIEADIAGTDFDTTNTLLDTFGSRPMIATEQLNWLGTVRARLGFTPAARWLVYGTGGLAYGRASLSTVLTNTAVCAGLNICPAGAASAWLTGWSAGAGAEWAFLNNWTVRLEYLHFDLGTLSHAMADPAFPFIALNAQAGFKGDIARVGINYLFK
jgi:outer membrane immunogenic protein